MVKKAIDESLKVRAKWEAVPLSEKIKLFMKAADLVSGKYRMDLNATTMLGQVKTLKYKNFFYYYYRVKYWLHIYWQSPLLIRL